MGPIGKLKALNMAARKQCGMKATENDSTGIEAETLRAYSSEYDYADKIINLRHNGWYTDSDGDGFILRGQVWTVASDNGLSDGRYPVYYIAGYVEESGAYVCLDVTRGAISTFDDARDAAYAADSLAERHAETEREYNEKWQEASRLSDDIESLKTEAREDRKEWRTLSYASRELIATEFPDDVAHGERLSQMAEKKGAAHGEKIESIAAKRERIAELGMAGEF